MVLYQPTNTKPGARAVEPGCRACRAGIGFISAFPGWRTTALLRRGRRQELQLFAFVAVLAHRHPFSPLLVPLQEVGIQLSSKLDILPCKERVLTRTDGRKHKMPVP